MIFRKIFSIVLIKKSFILINGCLDKYILINDIFILIEGIFKK